MEQQQNARHHERQSHKEAQEVYPYEPTGGDPRLL